MTSPYNLTYLLKLKNASPKAFLRSDRHYELGANPLSKAWVSCWLQARGQDLGEGAEPLSQVWQRAEYCWQHVVQVLMLSLTLTVCVCAFMPASLYSCHDHVA